MALEKRHLRSSMKLLQIIQGSYRINTLWNAFAEYTNL